MIMAFLAHLHTFTWIAWINDREAGDQGIRLDLTHPTLAHRCAHGSWSRATDGEKTRVRCLGRTRGKEGNKWTEKHDQSRALTSSGCSDLRGMMSW